MAACKVVACGIVCTVGLAGPAAAQDYPSRRIELIVPYPPAGAPDILGRAVAEKLTKSMGQPVVVVNRPGSGSDIGAQALSVARPDGYTIGILGNPQTIHHLVTKDSKYEFERSFQPITRGVTGFFVLVVNPKKLNVRTVGELVAAAKSQPGKFNFASGGIVTSSHLAGEWFKSATGTQIEHVPYIGSAAANLAILSGQVDMLFAELGSVSQYLASGELRAVAVSKGEREPAIPDVPTLTESGVPVNYAWWLGFVAPKGVPAPAVALLNQRIVEALRSEDVLAILKRQGLQPLGDSVEAFSTAIARERETMARVVQEAGIQPR